MAKAVIEFFTTGKMLIDWRTFITLFSKKLDVVESNYYRSISLCTTIYKICAKLMVERMKPILSCLIYHE